MYRLKEYTGLCSRHSCPMCGKKHSFVYYVDENNIPLDESVGRCNRENKCGYHYTPKEYFRNNPEAKKVFAPQRYHKKKERVKPLCTIPFRFVSESKSGNNDLIRYMQTLFDETTIQRIVDEYYLGSTQRGDTIFWQIDNLNRVRTGKIQGYNSKTGKRLKGECNYIDWVHSKLKKLGGLPKTWELTQCLFGEHLLTKYPDKVVAIVEGEKNALFGAAMFDDCIWLATGCKQGLSIDKLKALKGRSVIMYPDADGYNQWLEQSKSMQQCSVKVSDLTITTASEEEIKQGYDIVDCILKDLLR